MNDLVFQPLNIIATAIREKEITAVEVLDAHLGQIAKHNPAVNAIVTLNEKEAKEQAALADTELSQGTVRGPLHGVPVTIKDTFETAGLLTTASFKPLADYIPVKDATVVARLREAGAIILGKTNMPELAMDVQSNSPIFGRANNPWDLDRTPGGSTGGGGAAVAAGFSPLEVGSDLAGSVRIPAHFCGVFGFKPTNNRISIAGHIPDIPPVTVRGVRHSGCPGVLARSVKDIQIALKILEGPDGRDWEVPPTNSNSLERRNLDELRIAWTDDFHGAPLDEEIRQAMAMTADKLANLGCRVENCVPADFNFPSALETGGQITGAELGSTIPAIGRFLMRLRYYSPSNKSDFVQGLRSGLKLDLPKYMAALSKRDAFNTKLDNFLMEWDAWLCPVTAMCAFPHWKQHKPFMVNGQPLNYTASFTNFTAVFSMTGNPVMVLPVSQSVQGLPIGLQLIGRCWHDFELLEVADLIASAIVPFRRPTGF